MQLDTKNDTTKMKTEMKNTAMLVLLFVARKKILAGMARKKQYVVLEDDVRLVEFTACKFFLWNYVCFAAPSLFRCRTPTPPLLAFDSATRDHIAFPPATPSLCASSTSWVAFSTGGGGGGGVDSRLRESLDLSRNHWHLNWVYPAGEEVITLA